MIKTVFLDLDGVICNFRKGIYDAFNKPYNYSTLSPKWNFWNDWPGVTFEMMNKVCNISFWRNLEWTHDGHDILQIIFNWFNINQIYLLTTPMPNVWSPTGKWMWIKKNLPEFYKRAIITQAPKSLLARSDALLIDDKFENVNEFIKAGGHGILVPRSWNTSHKQADISSQIVKNELENLK